MTDLQIGKTEIEMAHEDKPDRPVKPEKTIRIFVQRDFTEGTAVKFQVKYPLELEGKLPQTYFDETLNKINSIFANAEEVGCRTYTQGCFSCLTAYLIYACFDTHYDKCMKKLAAYINEQNEHVYVPRGLMLINPMERGLRVKFLFKSDSYIQIFMRQEIKEHCQNQPLGCQQQSSNLCLSP